MDHLSRQVEQVAERNVRDLSAKPVCGIRKAAEVLQDFYHVKGPVCSFGEGNQTQNLNMYDINEVIIKTQKCN